MDSDDLRSFTESLRQAAQRHTGLELDAAIDALGWADALLDEPAAATAAWFAIQGELNVSSSALDGVLLRALGLPAAATTAVVLPALGTHSPPGSVTTGKLVVHGVGSRRLSDASEVVIIASHAEEQIVLRLPAAALDARPVKGMDPAGGWVEVNATLALPHALEPCPGGWDAATIAGQLAVAQELAGAARSMLRLARDHAVDRLQFGRPIGSFQAVRHRLADSLLAVESAEAAVTVGWAEPSPFNAAVAKAIAGRSGRTVARHAQQVLAGMGFTREHRFHGYLRRTLVLDHLFGTGADLSTEIGDQALRSRQLPAMLSL